MKLLSSITTSIIAIMAMNAAAVLGTSEHQQQQQVETTHHRMLNAVSKPLPMMTFFIPLQEQSTYNDIFLAANLPGWAGLSPPVVVMLSVTISTDKTVIWYDHWEDGFDIDVTSDVLPVAKSTEIWGDGNAANGCAPHIRNNCTNMNDILNAGTSIVVQNDVPLPRNPAAHVVYDGGDRIQASFPVAVTRASFPKSPGSVFAGAVEMYDTTMWGQIYEAPVGAGTYLTNNTDPFEISGFSCLAAEDNTRVTMPNGTVSTLRMGQSIFVPVRMSNQVRADKPIQVVLLTLDKDSLVQTRWYTMRPVSSFQRSYVSPVGDSVANTAIIVYNAGPSTMTYTVTTLVNSTTIAGARVLRNVTHTLNSKQAALTGVIPHGSGAILTGDAPFVALTITDSNAVSAFGTDNSKGDKYDWGIPLLPRNELTSQVQIGLAYGCTNNRCDGRADRSPIWLTAMEDADVYIDYQNTGVNQVKRSVGFLESIIIADPFDNDMSGASIFAVKRGDPKDGRPVDIATAWGQNPVVSSPEQSYSLDMGTTVPPFSLIKIAKTADKAIVNPGEELTYTIRVSNVGHKDLPSAMITLNDVLDEHVTYVAGSTRVSSSAGSTTLIAVPDDSSGTPFPLDAPGYLLQVALPRRGGTAEIVFRVKTAAQINKSKIVNTGTATQVGGGIIRFETSSSVNFDGAIVIENTVYLGVDGGAKCGTSAAAESVTATLGSEVTYCFKVINTGKTHLNAARITNPQFNFTRTLTGTLAPGASQTVFVNNRINGTLTNTALVVATPVLANGGAIQGAANVMSTDPSNVLSITPIARVNVTNVVYIGTDNGAACNRSGIEKVVGMEGTDVVYCFTVINTGDTHLNNLILRNPKLNNYANTVNMILAPGGRTTVALPGTIVEDVINLVDVTATPVLSTGFIIPGLSPVKNSDPSEIDRLSYNAKIIVDNTVYLGRDGGKRCGTPAAVEEVSGLFGANVTYCFKVLNDGVAHLSPVRLENAALSFRNDSAGMLAPQQSTMLFFESTITSSLTNEAKVFGNPAFPSGKEIPNKSDVTWDDKSKVFLTASSPKIELTNKVLLGHDASLCSTSAAREYVEDFKNANVTYCFVVMNSGNTFLNITSLRNPELNFTDTTVRRLAPGVSTTVTIFRTITKDLENKATVVGKPVNSVGVAVPNTEDTSSTDSSKVGEIKVDAAVRIANSVYMGANEHRSCGTAVESVSGLFGAPVTYCFNVTNTGNTHLDNIRIGNDKLSFHDQSTIKPLAPNEWAIVTFPRTIVLTTDNSAKVTARPIRPDGSSLPLGEVTWSDNSEVRRLPHAPSVVVNNTVYIGVDGSCTKAVESVKDIYLTKVTYCLRVTNTGDSHLNSIKLDDKELNFTATLPKALAPGRSETVSIPGQITSDLVNTATVTANPILECGTDIPGVEDVKHSDPSKVEKQTFTASVSVANTVYLGHEDGKCGSSTESVKSLYDSKATFCFQITNTGQTHLRSLMVSNPVLAFNDAPAKTLAPGESLSLTFQSKIWATQVNNINVTALPVTADGREILDFDRVSATDPSNVELVKHSPAVSVANVVYLGNDGGKSCSTGTESVSEQFGKAVSYCFTITNNGNSHLNNILLVNEKLAYTNTSLVNLAPGQSITLTTPGKILSSLTNEVVVTATASMPDGAEIPNQDDVTGKDPSAVVMIAHKSGVNIENTVYLGGSDGGAKCSKANETATGYPNTGVMYCFEIKNVGESHLKDLVIKNVELNFTDTSIKLLAPQETKVLAIPRMITKDLKNTATATGTPALSDGTKIGGSSDVADADTSSVDQIEYSPKIAIENSVYEGIPTDKRCGTDAARDGVDGIYGTKVTYCFKVTNTGDASLKDIKITNGNLQYEGPVKDLAPKESVIIPLEKLLTSDLKNTAKVVATPTIPGLSAVSSQDDSSVNKLDFVPGVKIINKVYIGSGDVARCSTDAALESVSGVFGTAVTYCFTIVNTGDSHLAEIKVTNGDLSYTKADFKQLANGENITVAVPGTITKDQKNMAVVVANPVTASGLDIPDANNVKSEDDSKVLKTAHDSSVSIVNTLYLGKDGGVQCGTSAAVDTVTARYGEPVAYCFFVTNTGQSHLKNVVVDNKDLGFSQTIATLAPNATKMLTVDGIVTTTKANVAVATGTPSLQDGTIIPDAEPVKAQDPSYVVRTPEAPRILIDNLVVLGSDPAKCDSPAAADYVEHYTNAVVTYCFTITNAGDTHLGDVKLANPKLSFINDKIGVLPPGESVLVVLTSKIAGPLGNLATVTANPVLPDGKTDLPGLNDVSWSDGSAVGMLEYKPAIRVANTVYNGEDGGLSCAANGVESVSNKDGLKVVYCFTVTNIGDTHLNNIQLSNAELNYTDASIGLLAPQKSITVAFASSITANLTNNVIVVANPSLADGADISGAQDVTATDPSSVVLFQADSKVKGTVRIPYSPPTNQTQPCLQDQWQKKPGNSKNGTLLCSTKHVAWDVLQSTQNLKCQPGQSVNVTVNGTMRIDGPRRNLGWYVAADGGDALTGTCIVNGLQKDYQYPLFDAATNAAKEADASSKVVWLSSAGGNDDVCGDVVTLADQVRLTTPVLVDATLPCSDENDDGILDVALCFTWAGDRINNNANTCSSISNNVPGSDCSCYCTRYDIQNVVVETPVNKC